MEDEMQSAYALLDRPEILMRLFHPRPETMGRFLGRASAPQLASSCKEDMDSLIIKSGFADAEPLLAGFDDCMAGRRRMNAL